MVAVAVAGARLLRGAPTTIEVTPLDLGGEYLDVVVADGRIWLTVHTPDRELVLVSLDPVEGRAATSTPLPRTIVPVITVGDDGLWLPSIAPLDGVPRLDAVDPSWEDRHALVRFETENGRPQLQIITRDVLDGVPELYHRGDEILVAGLVALHWFDLRTGVERARGMWFHAHLFRDERFTGVGPGVGYELHRDRVRVVDLDTGDLVAEHPIGRFASLRVLDGTVWVRGEAIGPFHEFHRLDPLTGELSDRIDRDDLAWHAIRTGDRVWERHGPNELVALGLEQPTEDLWRQIDAETGDVLGEYRFGGYRVLFVAGEHLWLVRDGALARVPLAELG